MSRENRLFFVLYSIVYPLHESEEIIQMISPTLMLCSLPLVRKTM
jgi:hypothetical protein